MGNRGLIFLNIAMTVFLAVALLLVAKQGADTDRKQDHTSLIIARHVAALQRGR